MRANPKALARAIRDNTFVLSLCVAAVWTLRQFGLARSRAFYRHIPYRGIVKVDCDDGRHFRIKSDGHNIENGLYWDGLYAHEPDSMRQWVQFARTANVVLDIGANSGVFALAAAAVGAQDVHAFEPLPRIYDILTRNLHLNSQLPIQAWPFAVGCTDGTGTLLNPGGDAATSASLSREFVAQHFERADEVAVSIVAIDSFCADHGISQVDLIKIDVEGYEEYALRGMVSIVASCRPAILMEVLEGASSPLKKVIEELWPGLYLWEPIDEGTGHVSRNVLLLPLGTSESFAVQS